MYAMQASVFMDFWMKSMRIHQPTATDPELLEAFRQAIELKHRQILMKRPRSAGAYDTPDKESGPESGGINESDAAPIKKLKISEPHSTHIHITTAATERYELYRNPLDTNRQCPRVGATDVSIQVDEGQQDLAEDFKQIFDFSDWCIYPQDWEQELR